MVYLYQTLLFIVDAFFLIFLGIAEHIDNYSARLVLHDIPVIMSFTTIHVFLNDVRVFPLYIQAAFDFRILVYLVALAMNFFISGKEIFGRWI